LAELRHHGLLPVASDHLPSRPTPVGYRHSQTTTRSSAEAESSGTRTAIGANTACAWATRISTTTAVCVLILASRPRWSDSRPWAVPPRYVGWKIAWIAPRHGVSMRCWSSSSSPRSTARPRSWCWTWMPPMTPSRGARKVVSSTATTAITASCPGTCSVATNCWSATCARATRMRPSTPGRCWRY
jgi:hypothetical protein